MRVVILLVLVAILAGCTGKTTPADDPVATLATAGGLRGNLVDSAIRPIEGAKVSIQGSANTTSDVNGAWVLDDLDAGTYIVEASKPGLLATQTSATVIAGQMVTVSLSLTYNATSMPYVISSEWKGFVDCSIRLGTGGAGGSIGLNACNELGTQGISKQDVNRPHEFAEGPPDWFQTEIAWEKTQTSGSDLAIMVGPIECADPKYYWMSGASPLFYTMDSFELNARSIGPDIGLCTRVFASTSEDLGHVAGLQFQQEFSGYSHAFYNFIPDDGWLFTVDGAPRMP